MNIEKKIEKCGQCDWFVANVGEDLEARMRGAGQCIGTPPSVFAVVTQEGVAVQTMFPSVTAENPACGFGAIFSDEVNDTMTLPGISEH